jgi:hypothetical protein
MPASRLAWLRASLPMWVTAVITRSRRSATSASMKGARSDGRRGAIASASCRAGRGTSLKQALVTMPQLPWNSRPSSMGPRPYGWLWAIGESSPRRRKPVCSTWPVPVTNSNPNMSSRRGPA